MNLFRKFKCIQQHDGMDCGPSCLAMITHYHGKKYTIQELREYSYLARDGVSLLGIEDAANEIGLETMPIQVGSDSLIEKKPLPCILHWENNHFVVLYRISKSLFSNKYTFHVADPSFGRLRYNKEEFDLRWANKGDGVALLLSPTEEFDAREVRYHNRFTFSDVLNFIRPNKREFFILFFGFLFSSIFTLIFPYLTQALIDVGISSKNLDYILLILIAQLVLFIGSTTIDLVRNWVLMFVNSMINIQIISQFLTKVIRLPFYFFDTKQMGDFSSRIQDHSRIQSFLTSQSLMVVFSSINFIVYFFVLSFYDVKILLTYIALTLGSIIWSLYFLNWLEKLDYNRFRYAKAAHQTIYELVNGIVEIKLNSGEDEKVKDWKKNQSKLFQVDFKSLKISQYQSLGFDFLNQFKNILIVFLSAREVVLGNITLGTLLAISYIIGMMNAPLSQLIEFFRSLQFAKLSFMRLNEVQLMDNEDETADIKIADMKNEGEITLKNVDFHYYGFRSPKVLDNINLSIPYGKVTAIVGESGSGKTTLMKLLLKFYEPFVGNIYYSNVHLERIIAKDLREKCGVVMQDGYIFSDTLERNIAVGGEQVDPMRLDRAIKIANLGDYVGNLPLGLKTMLGSGGGGISGGQKQRILIARAVYKNPDFIYLDEATSSLDSENEKIIYDNLEDFLVGKTVIKIAHRLSTVKKADQIVVMKKGSIVEIGTHKELVEKRGVYFNLVKNQLELSV